MIPVMIIVLFITNGAVTTPVDSQQIQMPTIESCIQEKEHVLQELNGLEVRVICIERVRDPSAQ